MLNFYEEALNELDKLDGTLYADVIEVQDGFYSQEMVMRGKPLIEDYVFGQLPTQSLEFDKIPCHKPRFRKQLVWKDQNGVIAQQVER